jgi:hypothetical protein
LTDIGSFKLGDTSDNLSLNAALVVSSSDSEESLVSPTLIPAVGDEPVRSAVLNSPSHDLDGVTAEGRAGCVVVDSGLVGEEVVVDGECSLNGAVGHDLSLDLGGLRGDGIDGVSNPSVGGVATGVSISAGVLALGSGLFGTAGTVRAIDVVVALLEGVGHAPVGGVVEPPGDDTRALPVVEGTGRVPSVAA